MEMGTGEVSHTYFFTGEFGGLMCMKSGWLERRKQDVETILSDLPWDGLYFDWCTYHPCCNGKHAPGWHTDVNEFLDFVMWCRRRIGKKGFLFVHFLLPVHPAGDGHDGDGPVVDGHGEEDSD